VSCANVSWFDHARRHLRHAVGHRHSAAGELSEKLGSAGARMPRKLALCSSTLPDRHLSYHSPYLVPQPYITAACLSCGQKKTAAATLKATDGLSRVLSASISVPEEEVAPLDARQHVLGATGWYDRVSWPGHARCSCRSRLARAGRHSSCPPIQDELSQAWKWQCLVHEQLPTWSF
jgi:hypothetical protein